MHATIIPNKNGYIMPIHQVAVLIHHSEPSLPKSPASFSIIMRAQRLRPDAARRMTD